MRSACVPARSSLLVLFVARGRSLDLAGRTGRCCRRSRSTRRIRTPPASTAASRSAPARARRCVAPASGVVSFAGSVPTSGQTVTIQTPAGLAVSLTHLGSIARRAQRERRRGRRRRHRRPERHARVRRALRAPRHPRRRRTTRAISIRSRFLPVLAPPRSRSRRAAPAPAPVAAPAPAAVPAPAPAPPVVARTGRAARRAGPSHSRRLQPVARRRRCQRRRSRRLRHRFRLATPAPRRRRRRPRRPRPATRRAFRRRRRRARASLLPSRTRSPHVRLGRRRRSRVAPVALRAPASASAQLGAAERRLRLERRSGSARRAPPRAVRIRACAGRRAASAVDAARRTSGVSPALALRPARSSSRTPLRTVYRSSASPLLALAASPRRRRRRSYHP